MKIEFHGADHFERRPAHTFIVHGEEEASLALASALERRGFTDVNVPHLGQGFEV